MPQIERRLQSQPKLRPVVAKLPEPYRHVRRNRNSLGEYAVKRLSTHAQRARGLTDPDPHCRQHVFTQNFTRMHRLRFALPRRIFPTCHRFYLSVILLKIDAPRLALDPFKRDSPRTIDGNSVTFRASAQRMQTKARKIELLQLTRLMQRLEYSQRTPLQIRPDTNARARLKQVA
jgi:hypothetical protein